MITLMSASAARKESELNMKLAAAKQWEEIESAINAAVRAGEFEIRFKQKLYEENVNQLEKLGYDVQVDYDGGTFENWYWKISW